MERDYTSNFVLKMGLEPEKILFDREVFGFFGFGFLIMDNCIFFLSKRVRVIVRGKAKQNVTYSWCSNGRGVFPL